MTSRSSKAKPGSARGEWVVAALGLALVAGTIAVLTVGALRGDGPPEIAVEVEAIEPVDGGYRVEFRAHNRGRTAAASVVIRGALRPAVDGAGAGGGGGDGAPATPATLAASATIEESEVTVPLVPAGSERRGGLFFAEDPRRHRLDLRAVSYLAP